MAKCTNQTLIDAGFTKCSGCTCSGGAITYRNESKPQVRFEIYRSGIYKRFVGSTKTSGKIDQLPQALSTI